MLRPHGNDVGREPLSPLTKQSEINMAKQIALVTGANKSIGLEAVRGLARLGMTVYLTSRDIEAGRAAAEQAKADGDVRYLHLDVTDEASMVASLDEITRAHGRLDVLVNNAGITLRGGDALNSEPEKLRATLETNFLGASRLLQLATPLLRASKAARVVNVTSNAGSYGYLQDPARPKPFAYCVSKAAMNAATMIFADALRADGIKVNAVCPGFVYSAVSAFQGTRTPEQGAAIILKMATLPEDGPTGGFFNDSGAIAW
jgi:NAD(P)-dependent dehydrogenase (short-subunit alcohol dehydrogenase family)